jgi:hypothetical protein
VDARVSTAVYSRNSVRRDIIFLPLPENGRGDANWDTGLLAISRISGADSIIEDSESCRRRAAAKSEGDPCPVRNRFKSNSKGRQ